MEPDSAAHSRPIEHRSPASHNEGTLANTIREASSALDEMTPEQRIAWALDLFPDSTALSTSFGAQSAVLLHMASKLNPNIPVIFIDTGYHFTETYQFADQLADRLKLNLKVYQSTIGHAWQEARHGKLWEQGAEGLELYNRMNKVEPMQAALAELGVSAWMAGLRRQQARTRSNLPVVAIQEGRAKIHPIIDWTDRDVFAYLSAHSLPYHPLWEQGYVSIGDWHSTSRLTDGLTPEETRFNGIKRECGLHENVDFVI